MGLPVQLIRRAFDKLDDAYIIMDETQGNVQ